MMILQATLSSGMDLMLSIVEPLIGIMIFIIAIAYMLGTSLGKSDWIAFSKIELSELIKTIVIFIIIIALYYFFETIALYIINKIGINLGNLDMITYASILLRDILLTSLRYLIRLTELEHQMTLFSDATGKVGPGTANLQIKLMVGADMLSGTLKTLNYLMLLSVHSINVQLIGLSFALLLTTYVFFPVGVILRLIPPLRTAGNELISLGIVVSILIPFMYILMLTMSYDVVELQSVNGWKNFIYEQETEKVRSESISLLREYSDKGKFIEGVEKIALIFSPYLYITPSILTILPKIAWILFFAVALPSFIINIAGSMIRGITAVLELDIQLDFM